MWLELSYAESWYVLKANLLLKNLILREKQNMYPKWFFKGETNAVKSHSLFCYYY